MSDLSKRHRRVYLAGPMFGCTDDQAATWREQAKARLGKVHCIDPMRRDYRGLEQDPASIAELVEADKEDILMASDVLANCWQVSWGTSMEIFFSHLIGKPVIAIVPPGILISPWLRYHTEAIVTSLDEALIRLGV
jgi:nucleoside 2-deoxyribosyltransferase